MSDVICEVGYIDELSWAYERSRVTNGLSEGNPFVCKTFLEFVGLETVSPRECFSNPPKGRGGTQMTESRLHFLTEAAPSLPTQVVS